MLRHHRDPPDVIIFVTVALVAISAPKSRADRAIESDTAPMPPTARMGCRERESVVE